MWSLGIKRKIHPETGLKEWVLNNMPVYILERGRPALFKSKWKSYFMLIPKYLPWADPDDWLKLPTTKNANTLRTV